MDGAGDIPAAWLAAYEIEVIPINIHFGEKTYLQGVDLTNPEFYRLVYDYRVIPKTSQPSPRQFIDFYRRIARPGDTVLSLHVTSRLSGTFASAESAARELEGEITVIPFDSASGSAAMGYLCQEARLLDRAGASLEAILAHLAQLREQIAIILTLDTLEFARLSGRVRTLQAALASILNLKPVVILRDGVLDMADRVRTRRRSLERVLEMLDARFGGQLINAAVVHAQDLPTGQELLEMVRLRFHCQQLILTELSISVAANLGPGTVGVVAYPVRRSA
jgi:DegV family protein with EDD domain